MMTMIMIMKKITLVNIGGRLVQNLWKFLCKIQEKFGAKSKKIYGAKSKKKFGAKFNGNLVQDWIFGWKIVSQRERDSWEIQWNVVKIWILCFLSLSFFLLSWSHIDHIVFFNIFMYRQFMHIGVTFLFKFVITFITLLMLIEVVLFLVKLKSHWSHWFLISSCSDNLCI